MVFDLQLSSGVPGTGQFPVTVLGALGHHDASVPAGCGYPWPSLPNVWFFFFLVWLFFWICCLIIQIVSFINVEGGSLALVSIWNIVFGHHFFSFLPGDFPQMNQSNLLTIIKGNDSLSLTHRMSWWKWSRARRVALSVTEDYGSTSCAHVLFLVGAELLLRPCPRTFKTALIADICMFQGRVLDGGVVVRHKDLLEKLNGERRSCPYHPCPAPACA